MRIRRLKQAIRHLRNNLYHAYNAWLIRNANRDRLVEIHLDGYEPRLMEKLRSVKGDVMYVGGGKYLPLNNRAQHFNDSVKTNQIPFYDL